MPSAADQLAFNTVQAARVAWFFGQKLLAARLGRPLRRAPRRRRHETPDRCRLLADLRTLLEQDWRNIEAGYYAPPEARVGNPVEALRRAADFFADLEAVEARRRGPPAGRRLEVADAGRYPHYYLQKFHFQSDGYLSDASAARYDHQVEVLFGGGAAAMRRRGLVPLKSVLAKRPAGRLLDIGCGTGRFLREVKANYPRLHVTGLDLSPPYLAAAGGELALWSRVRLVEGAAEAMPFADAEFDAVTAIYLFHELPPPVRRAAIAEIRRVLKPGGIFVIVDSLQKGDVPDYDAMLDVFPAAFHEPYYASYLREEFDLLTRPGFAPAGCSLAYFSKVLSYRRNRDAA